MDVVNNSSYTHYTSTTPRYESTLGDDGVLNTKTIYDTSSTLVRECILIKPHKLNNNNTKTLENSNLKRI